MNQHEYVYCYHTIVEKKVKNIRLNCLNFTLKVNGITSKNIECSF